MNLIQENWIEIGLPFPNSACNYICHAILGFFQVRSTASKADLALNDSKRIQVFQSSVKTVFDSSVLQDIFFWNIHHFQDKQCVKDINLQDSDLTSEIVTTL